MYIKYILQYDIHLIYIYIYGKIKAIQTFIDRTPQFQETEICLELGNKNGFLGGFLAHVTGHG